MLFDQEANKLQQDFNRLGWLKFTAAWNAGALPALKPALAVLEVSAPGADMLRLRHPTRPSPRLWHPG
jgi:hypothetical protein